MQNFSQNSQDSNPRSSNFRSPIWDPDFKQPAAGLGGVKAAALAAATAASGSSDSDSLSSRWDAKKRGNLCHSIHALNYPPIQGKLLELGANNYPCSALSKCA
jgi:hypothetical protein